MDGEVKIGKRTRAAPLPESRLARTPPHRERASILSDHRAETREPARRRSLSPLTLRILALNILALGILVGGLLYLGEYQRSLVDAQLEALGTQGRIIAGALGESTVTAGPGGIPEMDATMARRVVRRLVTPTRTRARLYDADGALVVDSRTLGMTGGAVQVEELPPPRSGSWLGKVVINAYDWVVDRLPGMKNLPRYTESAAPRASDYPEVMAALAGEAASAVRRTEDGDLVLSYAVPVQRLKKVTGALLLSTGGAEIRANVRTVRLNILKIFGVTLTVTVLLSLYLAGTIARPIRRLAAAADRVRHGHSRQVMIPDFTRRRDEIGDLSGSLSQMTKELWERMEAIERFAADVAHEIKNPLTSLRSAVETAAKVTDPVRQRKLMAVVLDDVDRLDRLITDISRASRLEAELSRSDPAPVDVGRMLQTLVEIHHATAREDTPRIRLTLPAGGGSLAVMGIEDRLVQVFQNVIANAVSFSPKGGSIGVRVDLDGDDVRVSVEDEGPGIPEAALDSIFDRFYSERPAGEKFGTHSGLGLSISRQIVELHGGAIHAENVRGPDGHVRGARFVIRLPRAARSPATAPQAARAATSRKR